MNIFQKIRLINKVNKAVKEIKKFLKETHLNKDIKDAIKGLKDNAEKLVSLAPQLKEAFLLIKDILK